MGNEHSKNKDPSKLNQCDKNGGLNALTGNNTSNGLEIDVNSLTQNQQNGKAAALNPATESEYVVVQSDSQDAESEDVPEKLAATPQREEAEKHEGKVQLFDKIFKKKGETDAPVDAESITEEETHKNIARDANLPCTDTLLASSSSREDTVATSELKEDPDYLHRQTESYTQTDRIIEADISTQTGDGVEGPFTTKVLVEEMVGKESDKELSESDLIIAEEAVEESIKEESSDNQAAGIINGEITVDVIIEDIMFRAKRVEVTGEGEIQNPEKRSFNDSHEMYPEIPVQYNPSENVMGIVEEVKVSRLQDGEGRSTDETLLNETAEPEIVMHGVREINDIPSVYDEPLITMMETISEEEEHLILQRTKPVDEKGVNIDQCDVLEDFLERYAAWHKELSTIDEVPENHFDECSPDAEGGTDEQIDGASETNAKSGIPTDGNKAANEIKEETVAALSQYPEFRITTPLDPSSAVRFVSCSSQQEKVPADSEPPFVETIIPTNDEITSGESTQKEIEAVLVSVVEDTPVQESFSQCEVTEASVEALAYRSELHMKIPAVPKQTAEETIIPTKDDMHFEESTLKKTEVLRVSVDEDTFIQELHSECNLTKAFVEAVFCSQLVNEISAPTKEETFIPAQDYAEKSTQIKSEVLESENIPIHELSCEAALETLAEAKCSQTLNQISAICKPIVKESITLAQDEIHSEDLTQIKNEVVLWNVEEIMKYQAQLASVDSSVEDECFKTLTEILDNCEPMAEEIINPAKDDNLFDGTSSEGVVSESSEHALARDKSYAENPAISDVPKEENESPHEDQGVTIIEPFDESMLENLNVCKIRDAKWCYLQAEPLPEEALDSYSSVQEKPVEENSVQNEETLEHDVEACLSWIDMEMLQVPLFSVGHSEENVSSPENQPTNLRTNRVIKEAIFEVDKCDACLAASKCLKRVIEAVVGEISEDAAEAEPSLGTSEDKATEMTSGAESSDDTTEIMPTEGRSEQKPEYQDHMKALLERLESSCTSVVEESPYRLEANQKPEALTEPEQTDNANSPPTEEETNLEESPVMNFFKNLNLTVTVPSLVRQMSSTKTSKKETPEVPKDQRQRENQSAPTTTVVQVSDPPAASKGMVIPPPPPPPELPKLEVKAEPSGKPAKPTTSKEKTKATPKSVESSKGKSTKDVLSKFFRPKTNKETQLQAIEAEVYPIVEKEDTPVDVPEAVVEVKAEEPQQTPEEATQMVVDEKFTVEGPQPEVGNKKVDPCKGGTLEAPAKPEPPALVHEEKKTPSKSPFFSLFKPKASDPKKASPAPAKAADALPTVKVKEESKAAVKSCEVIIDDKVASVAPKAVDSAANAARKSEKRNSIQLFLKHLGQKRHSTDAGVQTEPVTVAPAAK